MRRTVVFLIFFTNVVKQLDRSGKRGYNIINKYYIDMKMDSNGKNN